MKDYMPAILFLVVVAIVTCSVGLVFQRNKNADILMFCTKQYDDHATLDAPNTYFGDPEQCLNRIKELI